MSAWPPTPRAACISWPTISPDCWRWRSPPPHRASNCADPCARARPWSRHWRRCARSARSSTTTVRWVTEIEQWPAWCLLVGSDREPHGAHDPFDWKRACWRPEGQQPRLGGAQGSPPTRASSSGWRASRRPSTCGSAAPTAGCRPTRSSTSIPGELFVHRNVANLAPPQDANYLSVLQFAVDVIKVKHIMVVGHYGCGGVAAAVDGQRRGLVDHWLHPIREVHHEHRHELDAMPEERGRAGPAVRAQRDPPGEERRLRRLRAGRLGARPAALRPRLGLFARPTAW